MLKQMKNLATSDEVRTWVEMYLEMIKGNKEIKAFDVMSKVYAFIEELNLNLNKDALASKLASLKHEWDNINRDRKEKLDEIEEELKR